MDTEKRETTPTVGEVLKTIIDKNPEGGEININSLERQLSNMTRADIIRQLRKSNLGAFVTGRRGKPSRFVYGAAAIPHLHREQPQQQRISPPRRESESSEDPTTTLSHGIELRVNVGGQVTTIPIKLELGVAA